VFFCFFFLVYTLESTEFQPVAQSTAPAERDVVAYVELLRRTSEPLGLVLHGEAPVNVCALPIHCFLSFSQSEDQIQCLDRR